LGMSQRDCGCRDNCDHATSASLYIQSVRAKVPVSTWFQCEGVDGLVLRGCKKGGKADEEGEKFGYYYKGRKIGGDGSIVGMVIPSLRPEMPCVDEQEDWFDEWKDDWDDEENLDDNDVEYDFSDNFENSAVEFKGKQEEESEYLKDEDGISKSKKDGIFSNLVPDLHSNLILDQHSNMVPDQHLNVVLNQQSNMVIDQQSNFISHQHSNLVPDQQSILVPDLHSNMVPDQHSNHPLLLSESGAIQDPSLTTSPPLTDSSGWSWYNLPPQCSSTCPLVFAFVCFLFFCFLFCFYLCARSTYSRLQPFKDTL